MTAAAPDPQLARPSLERCRSLLDDCIQLVHAAMRHGHPDAFMLAAPIKHAIREADKCLGLSKESE